MLRWRWPEQSLDHTSFGAANQWTVSAGIASLARETAQNSLDARTGRGPVELVYTLIRLTGAHRRAFEDAIRWDAELRPHLEAMRTAARGAVSAGQLRAGLEALQGADALVLLRVADHGTAGLTGPEFDDGAAPVGNFVKLCRYDLFSDKAAAAGGSFGLGKAVLWRFSRVQTVLFGSTVAPHEGVDGHHRNRLFGVQQGVSHRLDAGAHDGRGHFGVPGGPDGQIASLWADDASMAGLLLSRDDERPGTTALVVGFYDPDDPSTGDDAADLDRLAGELRAGLEAAFWPALARGRFAARIDVEDDGVLLSSDRVDPVESFPALVEALHRFDDGDVDPAPDGPGSVVVRDVPVTVPRRRVPERPSFVHEAKLVVTTVDDDAGPLTDQVCLLRKPEMVVETIHHPVEGRRFQAFLLAGVAKRPDGPSSEDLQADDFLRFAEPPSHDRWIPGSGTRQVSQANLTAHYVQPWRRNLLDIDKNVRAALDGLFGTPPPPPDEAPKSVLRHLHFLHSEPGSGGGRGASGIRKPTATMDSGWVEDGRWVVDVTIRAQNRPEGWSFVPELVLVGLDGGRVPVRWDVPLEVMSPQGWTDGSRVVLPAVQRARVVKVLLRGVSTADLPVPAAEAVVEVVIRSLGPAPVRADG